MKWKYKVGDKIRMKKRTYSREDVAVGWVPAMDNYQRIYIVTECRVGNELKDPVYRVKTVDGTYQFIVQEWQIKYARKEKMII